LKKLLVTMLLLVLLTLQAPDLRAAETPLPIIVNEYVNATISTEGFGYLCGPWNVTGYIIVKNNNTGETVSDIWIPINKPSGLTISLHYAPSYATVSSGSPPSYVQADNSGANEFWHITQLRSGDNVTLKYTYTGSGCAPILVEERYDPLKIVDGVSSTVNVKLNITNNFAFAVDVKVRKVLPADNGVEGWADIANNPAFSGTPSTNVGGISYSSDYKELYWTNDGSWPDGWFTLAAGGHGNSTFSITGTPALSEVGGETQKITLGTVYIYLKAEGTFTGLTIGKVFAVGDASVEAKKEQDTTNPNQWKETLVFYDTSAIFKYDLFNTTVWATEGNTPSPAISGSFNSQQVFNITQLSPGGSYAYGPFSFTYNGIPKIWALAKFRITNDQLNGWWNYNNFTSVWPNGDVYYRVYEEIWAVRGYLVKAKKEVVSESPSCYVLGISLENLGQWETPYLEFYDVVPNGFSPDPAGTEGNMIFTPHSMLAVDADPSSPPDYSLITSPSGYSRGYVWKAYPVPAPQNGFAAYFKGTGSGNAKSIDFKLVDGSTVTLSVYPEDGSNVNIGGITYAEGSSFTLGSGPSATDFTVAYVDDNLTSGGGWVVVSAKGSYENLNMDVYNPIFVKYRVCGTGVYNATNLFIVGVDPRNTLDAIAVSSPNTRIGFGASTLEPLLLAIALIVSIAGVLARRKR
jgi:hypothetical protein